MPLPGSLASAIAPSMRSTTRLAIAHRACEAFDADQTQTFSAAVWGGAHYVPKYRDFSVEQYPIDASDGDKPYGIAKAPFG